MARSDPTFSGKSLISPLRLFCNPEQSPMKLTKSVNSVTFCIFSSFSSICDEMSTIRQPRLKPGLILTFRHRTELSFWLISVRSGVKTDDINDRSNRVFISGSQIVALLLCLFPDRQELSFHHGTDAGGAVFATLINGLTVLSRSHAMAL